MHASGDAYMFTLTSLMSNFAYCNRCYHSVVCLFVMFMHCAQTTKILTLFLLHTITPCLSQIALKFSLHWSTPSSLARKGPTPVGLSIRDIRKQTVTKWSEIAQLSKWRAYRKPSSWPHLPQMRVPNAPWRTNFVMCAATYWIWQKIMTRFLLQKVNVAFC